MKQVIDGLTYNTETAQEVGSWDNGLGRNDFNNCSETLYKTKNGRFFLAGEGGPMTRWSQPAGNMTSGGSGIQALTPEEALIWCEQHGIDADTIAEHFDVEDA